MTDGSAARARPRVARHERPVIDEAGLVAARHADRLITEARARGLSRWVTFFETLPDRLRDEEPAALRATAMRSRAAYGAKGLEFDTVFLAGWEEGLFPHPRALDEGGAAALEEERRLAYVAWTRARRSLTLLYDPAVPSPFLLEAFSPDELGLSPAPGAARG